MSRSKDLEKAVKDVLDLHGCLYVYSGNQTVKCRKCGTFQKARTTGWDFLVYRPAHLVCKIEVKTGSGKLTGAQKKDREKSKHDGTPYLEIRDAVSGLLEWIAERRRTG